MSTQNAAPAPTAASAPRSCRRTRSVPRSRRSNTQPGPSAQASCLLSSSISPSAHRKLRRAETEPPHSTAVKPNGSVRLTAAASPPMAPVAALSSKDHMNHPFLRLPARAALIVGALSAPLCATEASAQRPDVGAPDAPVPATRYVPLAARPIGVAGSGSPADNWLARNRTVASYDSMALTMPAPEPSTPAPTVSPAPVAAPAPNAATAPSQAPAANPMPLAPPTYAGHARSATPPASDPKAPVSHGHDQPPELK
jgi:hypothetical protein